ncbi:MAG TPA: hypothetical protein VM536_05455 [Chloroflexia bacterium]|nr:hypothetical protein [Chloroflexia bacterium]
MTLLVALPCYTAPARWRVFCYDAHVAPDPFRRLPRDAPPRVAAEHLFGAAANLVPAYDGPRRGHTALGDILTVLIQEPGVAEADRVFMAGLLSRYRLLPRDPAAAPPPPAVASLLAGLPPQLPAYYDQSGLPLPPAVADAGRAAVQAAAAAEDWARVVEHASGIAVDPDVAPLLAEAERAWAALHPADGIAPLHPPPPSGEHTPG